MIRYGSIFSTGHGDMGKTRLMEHGIPLVGRFQPVRRPPQRLGPEKEAQAGRPVFDLLQKGLMELSSGTWSSSVVLVKKTRKRRLCTDYGWLSAVTFRMHTHCPV